MSEPPDLPARPLAGRVALVTGAGSGIGRATAIRLALDGAAVGCLDRNAAGADETVAAIVASGGQAAALYADVTNSGEVAAAATRIGDELGPASILVNNAGLAGAGRFVDVSLEDWQRVVDSHVLGAFLVTRAVLPAMVAGGWGRIVLIASEAVWLGHTSVQYATAKAALVGFTRSLARQVAAQGVNVNAVAPGPVETPMFLDNTPDEIEAERRSVLIGRVL
ncbi:MAG TPA: SDR family NAD(P)-dependent oxidoreductase, partial [Candidatus Limnocylindrales bacterium]